MPRTTIRLWFALAVAVIAAALADPFIEAVSNSGLFGNRQFTDRSTIDVFPAVMTGAVLLGLYAALKTRAMLLDLRSSDRALDGGLPLLASAAFAAQLLVLFTMETLEQIAVYGHPLGGTIWLGGPPLFSLAVHAVVCVALCIVLARGIRSLAGAAAREVVRLARALALAPMQPPRVLAQRDLDVAIVNRYAPVLGSVGERAPPFL